MKQDFDDKLLNSYNRTVNQIEKIQNSLNLIDVDGISKDITYSNHIQDLHRLDTSALMDLKNSIDPMNKMLKSISYINPSIYGLLSSPSLKKIYQNSLAVDINSLNSFSEEVLKISHDVITNESYELDNSILHQQISVFIKSNITTEEDSQLLEQLIKNTTKEKATKNNTVDNQTTSEQENTSNRQKNLMTLLAILTFIWGIYATMSSSLQSTNQHKEVIEAIQELIDATNE